MSEEKPTKEALGELIKYADKRLKEIAPQIENLVKERDILYERKLKAMEQIGNLDRAELERLRGTKGD